MKKFILELSLDDMNNLNEAVKTHLHFYLEDLKRDTLREKNYQDSDLESIYEEMETYLKLHKRLEYNITINERVSGCRSPVLETGLNHE